MATTPETAKTKDQLIATIKEWLKNDNEIKVLQKEIKMRREKNQEISRALIQTMKENDLDRIDINSGKLVYSRRNVKRAITHKLLLELITQYDKNIAKDLTEYILANRAESVCEKIVLRGAGREAPNVEAATGAH
jgi:predicted ATP-grasp superfamily ATP-dependent carboligase